MLDNDNTPEHTLPRVPHWWKQTWPRIKVPVQLVTGQLIGWLIRKCLGE